MNTYYAVVPTGYYKIRAYTVKAAAALVPEDVMFFGHTYRPSRSFKCLGEVKERTIIAIDLEHKGGQILEICMHRLDSNLNILDTFEGVLPFNMENFSDFILDMHSKSGLVYAQATILPENVFAWLSQFENIVWLGSSVGFDARWMREHFPCKTSHR